MVATAATQSTLTGLPRRLAQDGVVSEDALAQALDETKQSSASLVAYLVSNELGDPRQIAIAAAHEFGVPLLDLDAIEVDLDVVRLVSEKLLNRYKVLPLMQRGKRLYIGVADPTNLQALDDIGFQTSLRVEPVVVEQDKLNNHVNRALEAVDTTMSSFDDDFDLENLEISGGDEEVDDDVSSSEIDDASAIARYARTLATTFAAGVPLVEALESVAGACGNVVYETAVLKIRDEVATGQRLQRAMENTALFPNMVNQMIAVGEESGSLDDMSSKVADFYEEEVDNAVDSMSSLLEPLIMSTLGVLVGGLVIAMYLPIFKMGQVV